MEKVYVFLADGFEEIEGLTVVDVLRRAGLEVETISIMGRKEVAGSHGICVMADRVFEEKNLEDGALYVLPGGLRGMQNLHAHEGLAKLIIRADEEGKRIAAICAAPSILGDMGLLRGKTAVCYPGFEEHLEGATVTQQPVEISDNITTSRGMGTALPFALSLAEQLAGKESADRVAEGILYR